MTFSIDRGSIPLLIVWSVLSLASWALLVGLGLTAALLMFGDADLLEDTVAMTPVQW